MTLKRLNKAMFLFLEEYSDSVERVTKRFRFFDTLLSALVFILAVVSVVACTPIHLPLAIVGYFLED